ncbi:DUF309 domain-containing protein [Tropicibacter sp. S64]|uniref:DUF309 domain-containing protein n=1 Tax=Tropicibacter sp. S64 TaxID=3415122 RepID=UPI003C7B06AE
MDNWLPPHAYVPGQTPRHPEGLFDASKGLAEPLEASPAFAHGLRFLEQGFFWEAHECLEPVWMAARENSGEKLLLQALIQLANARLKARMGRPKAEARLRAEAARLAQEAFGRGGALVLGLAQNDVAEMLEESDTGCAR